jgi:hypothetical protein
METKHGGRMQDKLRSRHPRRGVAASPHRAGGTCDALLADVERAAASDTPSAPADAQLIVGAAPGGAHGLHFAPICTRQRCGRAAGLVSCPSPPQWCSTMRHRMRRFRHATQGGPFCGTCSSLSLLLLRKTARCCFFAGSCCAHSAPAAVQHTAAQQRSCSALALRAPSTEPSFHRRHSPALRARTASLRAPRLAARQVRVPCAAPPTLLCWVSSCCTLAAAETLVC